MNFRSRDFWPKSLPFLEDQLRSRPKWSYAHWQFGPGFESCSKFLITVRLQTLTQILTKTVMKNKPPRVFSPRWLYSPNKSLLVVGCCWKHFPHSSVSLFQDFFSIFSWFFVPYRNTDEREWGLRVVEMLVRVTSCWVDSIDERSPRRMPFFLAAGAE